MSTLKHARQLAAVMQPLTGDRSSGTVRLVSTDPSVVIPHNTYLLPIVQSASGQGQIQPEFIFRTDAPVTVTPAGAPVVITSNIGGIRHNLPSGTVFRLHPAQPGMVQTAVATTAITGATDVSGSQAIKRIVNYEQLGAANVARDLFLGKVGTYPAVVLVWESTGEGLCYGSKIYLRPDKWSMHVVVSRFDAGELRSADGLDILDAVEEILTSRAHVDGEPFSSKYAQLHSRSRLAVTDSSYVYSVQFSTFHATLQTETRAPSKFPLWSKTKYNLITEPPDPSLNPPSVTVVHDATYNQVQPPPPFP